MHGAGLIALADRAVDQGDLLGLGLVPPFFPPISARKLPSALVDVVVTQCQSP
jgi:hypothetical protein